MAAGDWEKPCVSGLQSKGADIAIVSRKIEACEKVAGEIRALGRKAFAYACHVGHWNELDGMVDAVYKYFGKVDVLINNAGLSPVAPSLLETSEKLFDTVVGVNFKGPFRLSALVGSRMAAGAGGSIINISSRAATSPVARTAVYGGAKAALNTITRSLAHEYGPKVRVNCIQCGPFHTDVSKGWSNSEEFAVRAKAIPLHRAGEPEEIISTALYLASDASSFTTASIVRVDGGEL